MNGRKRKTNIEGVHLFGGAASLDEDQIETINCCNIKNIFNYYSNNDAVLKSMYRSTSFFTEDNPIGITPIKNLKNVVNVDVTDYVSGHTKYVENAHLFCKIKKSA
jgi:hypothetical protein